MEVFYKQPGISEPQSVSVAAVKEGKSGLFIGSGSGDKLELASGYVPYENLLFVLPDREESD